MHRWDLVPWLWELDERRTAERYAGESHPVGCRCRQCALDELSPEEKAGRA